MLFLHLDSETNNSANPSTLQKTFEHIKELAFSAFHEDTALQGLIAIARNEELATSLSSLDQWKLSGAARDALAATGDHGKTALMMAEQDCCL